MPIRRNSASPDAVLVADHLHSAAIHLLRRLRTRDAAMGFGPAQASALSVLVFAGSMSLGELAKAEGVRAATMSKIVASLIAAGLVQRQISEKDKRKIVLRPTSRGTQVLQAGRKRRVGALAAALQALPSADLRDLQNAADLIERILRQLT